MDIFFSSLRAFVDQVVRGSVGPPVNFICAGDFNINLLGTSREARRLINYMESIGAKLLNSLATTNQGSLLDHVWASADLANAGSARNLECYWSDHSPLHAAFRWGVP